MMKSCRSMNCEMVAMDTFSNKTYIDEVAKDNPIWIRGTSLRWIWDHGITSVFNIVKSI